MKWSARVFWLVLVAVAVWVGAWWLKNRSREGLGLVRLAEHDGSGTASVSATQPSILGSEATTRSDRKPSDDATREVARKRLDAALAELRAAADSKQAAEILAALKAYLRSLPPAVAAAVIADFLGDPARDAPTKIEFDVGPGGNLSGHPTLRVALLDWLGEIDLAAAAALGRTILATPTSADEWAVCLRHCAKGEPGSNNLEFLRVKTEELIRHPEWRANPSVGYLEAFDVLVHTRATASTPLLGELVRDKSPQGKAAAHAAFLTIDRLTLREPDVMMRQMAAQPELAKSRPEMVANLFARADLRDPEQQQLIRSYLLDPARTQTELTTFAAIYPNANFMISNNLLTPNDSRTGEELAAHDAAALAIVDGWLVDPAFEAVKTHLTSIRRRLAAFANSSDLK